MPILRYNDMSLLDQGYVMNCFNMGDDNTESQLQCDSHVWSEVQCDAYIGL